MTADRVADWERLHGVPASPLVRRWLALVHAVCARLPGPPDLWTGLGIACAAGALVLPVPALWVLMSLLCDAADGGIAVVRGRATRHGKVLDGVADRVCDVLFLVALDPGTPLLVTGLVGTAGLELPRLVVGPVRVTVAERPQRVMAVLLGLLVSARLGGAVLVSLLAVGLLQLVLAARARAR